jgi:hypothetical protein
MRVLNTEKACPALAEPRAFLFPSLPEASFRRAVNKKALLLSQQGFFGVDKRFEISNLYMNIAEIIKLAEILI